MVGNRKVLMLKVICDTYSIRTRDLAEYVGCTTSYIHGGWRTDHRITAPKRKKIIEYLRSQGISEALVQRAYEEVNELEEIARISDRGELVDPQYNPDEKLLTMGVKMLRRDVREFFNLNSDPFQPRRYEEPFLSKAFVNARNVIVDAIQQSCFLAVSGPTGCGKSVLWAHVHRELRKDPSVKVAAVKRFDKDRIKVRDIYRALLQDMAGEEMRGQTNEDVHRRIEALLLNNGAVGINTIMLINEAHDLGPEALVMLKRLWEINYSPEMGYGRAATVVLLGQERLGGLLRSAPPELREVSQRADLEDYGALMPNEIGPYIRHRFIEEPGAFERVFDESAIEFMGRRSIKLTPQLVNGMASNAMNVAFRVSDTRVTEAHVGKLLQ